jgi:hypothetical protein
LQGDSFREEYEPTDEIQVNHIHLKLLIQSALKRFRPFFDICR